MAEISQPGGMVPAEQVSAITHLSLTEVKELTRQGYLPKPQRGLYNLSQSLAGAFRWYDETRKLPPMVDKVALTQMSGLGDSMHRKLAATGHFPPPSKGRYELLPTAHGLIQYLRTLGDKSKGPIAIERQKKMRAQRRILEVAAAKAEGSALDAKEVAKKWEAIVMTIRGKLLSLPSRLGPRLIYAKDQQEMGSEIEKEIHAVLTELSREG
jgi:phage terminase Nu1 subunit (DNA packaging protein)